MATSHKQHLEGTIEALNSWDTLDGRDLPRIDGWVTALEDSDSDELSEIGQLLTQLREALGADSVDSVNVAQLLTQLGEKTQAAANLAEGELADQIRQLGDILVEAGGR